MPMSSPQRTKLKLIHDEYNDPVIYKKKMRQFTLNTLVEFDILIEIQLGRLNYAEIDRSSYDEKETFFSLFGAAIANNLISNQEIQERLAMDSSAISRWKNGETVPPIKKQIIIFQLIRKNIADKREKLGESEPGSRPEIVASGE